MIIPWHESTAVITGIEPYRGALFGVGEAFILFLVWNGGKNAMTAFPGELYKKVVEDA